MLWCFITPVLLALGQSEALSMSVQSFLRVLCLGAPAYIGFESVKKYLQVQGVMHASTAVLLVTSPLNVGLNYWLVFQTDLGLLGAPLATSITYWLSFGLICGQSIEPTLSLVPRADRSTRQRTASMSMAASAGQAGTAAR